jgi:rhodanese-related sulfurtransferase
VNKEGITHSETTSNCKANAIGNELLADLLYSENLYDIQFIDIRTPHQYAMGHLPGAINIPFKSFFHSKNWNKIPGDKVIILYGDDASTPYILAIMSKHFRNSYFYVISGGYDFVRDKILNRYAIYSGMYDDEVPVTDYQKFINELRNRSGGKQSVKKVQPKVKPVVKRKKKEVTGGCG